MTAADLEFLLIQGLLRNDAIIWKYSRGRLHCRGFLITTL